MSRVRAWNQAARRRPTRTPHLTCLLLLFVVVLMSPPTVSWSQEDYAGELPRIPPTDAAETLQHFRVADRFRIELVASEPLVASPVAIEWDADGNLFVCEMRGYSENRDEALSRIRRLTDSDQDGVYDHAVVFLDGLLWPTAIMPFDGGLFVGDAPDLLYCKDTDGDGVADITQVVLTGFGTSNVQGLMNSFRWGLDNQIHIACSSAGGTVHRPGEIENAVDVRGRDLAFNPRTFEFELTSGGGQHGMCFDDWGRKFVSSNSDHIQQVMYEDRYIARNRWFTPRSARVSIATDGPQAEVYRSSPVEPWRIVRTRLRVGGQVPGPIEGGGRAAGYFTGATGITIYRGDSWPQPSPQTSNELAIIGDVGSNLVHRKRLDSGGLPFTAHRIDDHTEFVTSSDIWFRPAQFANAPDGSLHVVDVCREVIEHPKSLPEEIKQHLDLTSGRDRGRIYRIVSQGASKRPAPRLAEADSLQLANLLEHSNAWHRDTAARLLYERQDKSTIAALRELAHSAKIPEGRLQAMYVLAGMQSLDADTILERMADEHPQVRRHAIRLCGGLPPSDSLNEQLTALVDDSSIEVRYQLAFSLGSIDHPDRNELLKRIGRRDVDSPWMRLAVQSSLVTGAESVFAELASDPEFRSDAAAALLGDLAGQLRRQTQPGELARVRDSVAKLVESEPLFALPIASQLFESSRGRAASAPDELIGLVIQSAAQIAADPREASGNRVRAIRAMSLGDWHEVGPKLIALIDNREPIEVQRAAIETSGRFPSDENAEHLLKRWIGLSPSLRHSAAEVLFARPDRTLRMFDAVDQGLLTTSDLPRDRLTIAANASNEFVKARALRYLQQTAGPARREVIASYQESLHRSGDLGRGRALFAKHCSSCHRVEGTGHEIGPNLASIRTRGPESILVNLLDPNAEVNPQYLNYVALTVDGRSMTGMIASENANSITLRRAESATDTVLRSDIELLQSTGKSIMPEGLEESLDQQAVADVIHYLMHVE